MITTTIKGTVWSIGGYSAFEPKEFPINRDHIKMILFQVDGMEVPVRFGRDYTAAWMHENFAIGQEANILAKIVGKRYGSKVVVDLYFVGNNGIYPSIGTDSTPDVSGVWSKSE